MFKYKDCADQGFHAYYQACISEAERKPSEYDDIPLSVKHLAKGSNVKLS